MLSSESDIEVMKEMQSGKNFVKINLTFKGEETSVQKTEEQPKKEKSPKQKKELTPEERKERAAKRAAKLAEKQKTEESPEQKTEEVKDTKTEEKDEKVKNNFKQCKKMGRGFFRENMRKNAISSASESKSKEKGENPWRRGGEMVIKRRTNRLSKIFGGKPEDYLEFVNKTLELELQDVICTYAKENNINLEEKIKDNFEHKLQRLSFFFNKSAEEYREIVVQNPNLHFRGVLKLLKEKGLE